jgi:elongation factor Tu
MGWWPFGRRERTDDKSVETLRAEAAAQAPAGPFRLTVEDVFTITGRGTVVTGVVESGVLAVGGQVDVVRADVTVVTTEVTGIEKFRATLDVASPGENVGLLLRDVTREQLRRGDVVQTRG